MNTASDNFALHTYLLLKLVSSRRSSEVESAIILDVPETYIWLNYKKRGYGTVHGVLLIACIVKRMCILLHIYMLDGRQKLTVCSCVRGMIMGSLLWLLDRNSSAQLVEGTDQDILRAGCLLFSQSYLESWLLFPDKHVCRQLHDLILLDTVLEYYDLQSSWRLAEATINNESFFTVRCI